MVRSAPEQATEPRKTRTGSVKRKINNAVTLVLELFRRAHGDKCYLQRNNKQKEPIDNQISPSNKVDVQEILSRLKKRPEYENAFYHVMNRGRGRRWIFHGDKYYDAFLKMLEESHERFEARFHAYCLMGNHYHLLVETPLANPRIFSVRSCNATWAN